MARKKILNKAQIDELLNLSDDSEFSTSESEFDDSVITENEAESEDDTLPNDSDEGNDDIDNSPVTQFNWSSRQTDRNKKPFTGSTGIQVNIEKTNDPLEYFKLFVCEELINLVVMETNHRAAQLKEINTKPKARIVNWTDTNSNEIMVYLAMILYQGLVQKPEMELYWSTHKLFDTPYIRNIMSERRFSLLSKCLHFVDNSTIDANASSREKSLAKISPVFDIIIDRFSNVYLPKENIAIDESLMLWKGRLSMKQYIPSKRARFGLKSYELCESSSGYIWKSILHTGPTMHLNDAPDNLISSRIVMTLMSQLLGKGYTLYLDNWYSSPSLFRELVNNDTNAVGTVRLGRKNMPKEMKPKIKIGETVSFYERDMMAMKWHDKREVSMLSTYHNDEMVLKVRRGTEKSVPVAITNYNENMGAVDVADQMLVAYPIERKRHKIWYKKQFRHLINQCVLNAFILYNKKNEVQSTHLKFRTQLIERIIEDYHGPIIYQKNLAARQSVEGMGSVRLTERHFPSFIPSTEGKAAPTRRCRVCCSKANHEQQKKTRKETRYMCSPCNVALCPAPCFEKFHTKKNY
jgi:hypothetical protein